MAFFWLLIFLAFLLLLIASSDLFVEKSEKLGLSLGMSSFIVGITVVAMGTSLPELVTSLFSIWRSWTPGHSNLLLVPLDTIIGSNIANILIVIGLSAIMAKTIQVNSKLIESDIPLLSIFTGIFALFLFRDQTLSSSEAWLCLSLFVVFLVYSINTRQIHAKWGEKRPKLSRGDAFFLGIGLLGVFMGGQMTIFSLEKVIDGFGLVNFGIITMVLVAISTSLPEVIVSLQAARKKKFELAIGNIFGSNVFNMLLIGGVAGVFGDLPMSPEAVAIGLPFLVVSTITFLFTAQDDHIGRWEGVGLLSMYVVFILLILGIVS